MKKTLAMLGIAGTLALSPKVQAKITPKTEETKKDLIEAVTTEQATPEEDGKIVTFQEAQKLQEQQLFEEIMEDEKIQELINEYGQEEVERTINEILTSKDAQKLMKKLLEDKKIQKALEKGDEEAVTERVEEAIKEHKGGSFWSKVANKLGASIFGIIIGIYIGKRRRY